MSRNRDDMMNFKNSAEEDNLLANFNTALTSISKSAEERIKEIKERAVQIQKIERRIRSKNFTNEDPTKLKELKENCN